MQEIASRAGFRKKSVLVVDDNSNVQKTLSEIAEGIGLEVVIAASRREATAHIDRRAFDCAVVDLRLVENDKRNRDGIAILRSLRAKDEGTKSIFLTGYGDFADATEAAFEIGVFQTVEKGPQMEERIHNALTKAVSEKYVNPNPLPIRIWSGRDDPVEWGTRVLALLKPSGGLTVMNNLLQDVGRTLVPLLRREEDNGLQPSLPSSAVIGLYWSRGVGEGIILIISREQLPAKVSTLPQWPKQLRLGKEPLYEIRRKNLVAAIIKCEGIGPAEFSVVCH